jgi:hypothetical protein
MRVHERALVAIAIALVVATAAWCYQPWRNQGFDIEDFSEFRPLLDRPLGFSERSHALLDYYASHGRWNVVAYYALAAKWTLLGSDPVAWQFLRFGQMMILAILGFVLARSFRLGNVAAAAMALLLVFSSAAGSAFTRLTMSEPLAATLFLAALLLAVRYQHTLYWKSSAVCIAMLVALLLGSKEVLIVCVPFVVLCAVLWSPEGWHRPEQSLRNLLLVGAVSLATSVVGMWILFVALNSGVESYVSQYGRADISLSSFSAILGWMVLPVQRPHHPSVNPPVYPANLLTLVLVVTGIIIWWRSTGPKPIIAVALFASLPVLGASVYAPWPRFEEFYALPFLLGTGLLLGHGLEAGIRTSPANGRLAAGLLSIAAVYMAANAYRLAERRFASRAVHGEMVDVIGAVSGVDSVLVVTSWGGRSWPTLAPTLARVAAWPPGSPRPPVLGSKCKEVPPVTQLPRSILVMQDVGDCGPLSKPDRTIVQRYRYWNWQTWRRGMDSIRVDVKLGERSMVLGLSRESP